MLFAYILLLTWPYLAARDTGKFSLRLGCPRPKKKTDFEKRTSSDPQLETRVGHDYIYDLVQIFYKSNAL